MKKNLISAIRLRGIGLKSCFTDFNFCIRKVVSELNCHFIEF